MEENADKVVERHTKLLELMLSETGTYHNHKETMAHAGTALQLAVMTWVVAQSVWPPSWVHSGCISPRTLTVFSYFLIWLLIHVFVRWQLRKRRAAALESATYLRTLRKWAFAPPSPEDLKPYEEKHNKVCWIEETLDFFVPVSSASPHRDVDKNGYPIDMVSVWKDQETKGTGAIKGEWLLWFASILMFLMGLSRMV